MLYIFIETKKKTLFLSLGSQYVGGGVGLRRVIKSIFYLLCDEWQSKSGWDGRGGTEEKKHFDEMINVRMVNQLSLTTGDYFFVEGSKGMLMLTRENRNGIN